MTSLNKKKVLCIGDSLGLPGHLNSYEDTWFYKLSDYYREYHFIQNFRRQATSDVLVTLGGGKEGIDKWPHGADCLESFCPNIVVLQLGIVDCAPRLLYPLEKKVLSLLPKSISKLYATKIKQIRKRDINNVDVNLQKFKANLTNYILRAEHNSLEKLIIIKICTPDYRMVEANPKILDNVYSYNLFLDYLAKEHKIVSVIDPLNSNNYSFEIFEDGYHPNKKGHELVYTELISLIA